MVAEKLYEFAAKEMGAAYAHGENCIHAPAAALPWGKAALQAGGAAQGRPGLGAHWGHPANGPPLSRHNSRRAFVQAVLAYGCSSYLTERLLNPRRREEVRFAAPYCPAPGARLYHWTILDNMADIHAHGLRPANRGGYVYITDDPDYIANSSYFYW